MVYEALVVIGFGIALAVVSVGLFVAHVKRINAPNRVDPTGVLVHIDLGDALAKDENARVKKLCSKSSSVSTGASQQGNSDAIAEACVLHQGGGLGRRRRRASSPANGNGEEKDPEELVKLEAPIQQHGEHDGLEQENPSERTASMVLPSPIWAEAIVKHADVKRRQLRRMVKSGEIAAGWESKWERLPPPRKRKVLVAVREELVHAVSSYVGRDEALFDVICPHLSVSALEENHRGISGLSRLVRGCLDGKLPEPRSRAFATVQGALTKASMEGVSKDKRGPVRAFLPTFRKLCSSSFCIGALEAIESGRADGMAGPTVGSVCTALVKTGGSSILIYAFFYGLKQMSVSETSDPAGLPTGLGEEGVGGA